MTPNFIWNIFRGRVWKIPCALGDVLGGKDQEPFGWHQQTSDTPPYVMRWVFLSEIYKFFFLVCKASKTNTNTHTHTHTKENHEKLGHAFSTAVLSFPCSHAFHVRV
jgi:hypothetical protein